TSRSHGMKRNWMRAVVFAVAVVVGCGAANIARAQDDKKPTSYAKVDQTEPFASVMKRISAEKAAIEKKQADLLLARYDLADKPHATAKMSRGQAVQAGVRVKLPAGVTWDQLAAMSPAEVREKDVFPQGFLPLPHPNHPEGGMLFPQHFID